LLLGLAVVERLEGSRLIGWQFYEDAKSRSVAGFEDEDDDENEDD
jgi:hypothetical protein